MVQTPQFWENESLDALEGMRRELREIVHLLKEQRQNKKFVIDIEDEYTTSKAPVNVVIQTTYKQRVIDYLAENSNNETLRKIQNFEQLTAADIQELERIFFEELGTKDEYNAVLEGIRSGKIAVDNSSDSTVTPTVSAHTSVDYIG